jgi:hypothetical protein
MHLSGLIKSKTKLHFIRGLVDLFSDIGFQAREALQLGCLYGCRCGRVQ